MFSNGLETKMLFGIRLSRERRDWITGAVDKAIVLFVIKKKKLWGSTIDVPIDAISYFSKKQKIRY